MLNRGAVSDRPKGVAMLKHLRTAAILWLVAGVIVALSTTSFAQKQALPKYDTKAEVHLAKATVQESKEVTLSNGQQRILLTVKAGDEVLDVYTAPKAFLDMMDTAFAKDDEVDITGSKLKDADGKTIILAREIIKGQNTVVLRDQTGAPAWTWMEKNKTAEGK